MRSHATTHAPTKPLTRVPGSDSRRPARKMAAAQPRAAPHVSAPTLASRPHAWPMAAAPRGCGCALLWDPAPSRAASRTRRTTCQRAHPWLTPSCMANGRSPSWLRMRLALGSRSESRRISHAPHHRGVSGRRARPSADRAGRPVEALRAAYREASLAAVDRTGLPMQLRRTSRASRVQGHCVSQCSRRRIGRGEVASVQTSDSHRSDVRF